MASAIVNHSCTTVVSPPVPSAANPPKSHRSVYEIVTARILEQLEQGVVPWRKPQRAVLPSNLISGKPYRGVNVFLLASQGFPESVAERVHRRMSIVYEREKR